MVFSVGGYSYVREGKVRWWGGGAVGTKGMEMDGVARFSIAAFNGARGAGMVVGRRKGGGGFQ